MAFKKSQPGLRFSGEKVGADELDQLKFYHIQHPSISTVYFGTTAGGTAGQSAAFGFTNIAADYPRNLFYQIVGTASIGGTITMNGKDQFGNVVAETVAFATATNGGSIAGTQIFSKVSSGTCNFATASAAGNGTAKLGVAIGTAGTTQFLFGLPDKLGGSADVKLLTWINNGTATAINGGTIGAYVNVAQSAAKGTQILAITDEYTIAYRPTYVTENNLHSL